MPLQPASSPYADLFVWKSSVTIPFSADELQPTANDTETDQLQFLGDSFFCLMSFMGSTNYDPYTVSQIAGPAFQVAAAKIPNNFKVLISQDNAQKMSNIAIPQACICGSGYTPGNQFPYPMLLPPMTSIDFEYQAINPWILFSDDEQANPIPLEISFGLYGYNVPTENLEDFLASWPAMQRVAKMNQPMWAQNFTSMAIPGLTA